MSLRHVFVLTLALLYTHVLWMDVALAKESRRTIYLRANQVGYLPEDSKIAIAFAHRSIGKRKFEIIDTRSGKRVWGPGELGPNSGTYGNFAYHYRLDFSEFDQPGRYQLRITRSRYTSLPFNIGAESYNGLQELLLYYIRQQRCGYNPFLDVHCHQQDGRTVYGPMPDSTYIDVTGGWHDAGDYLRYLLTSGNSVCRMLCTYRENKGKFADEVNALGQPDANGIPDILDEAKWGLDWMLKMHPEPDQLFHQVADDRDHVGWQLPHEDIADYGWGPNSYRVVYYANGQPQGLFEHQNTSTGIANLAGRYAAAMAMACDIWKNDLGQAEFAARCLQAGIEVYHLGKAQPGCQEGTPCRAPYRYHEITWADDMEWGAAELYRLTGEDAYLEDARSFARISASTSWMGADTARHYEYYPFMNMGHYALYPLVDKSFQDTLAGYCRESIDKVWARGKDNPYHFGVPFIWCSNNLASAFINHIILYERMTDDTGYHTFMLENRDWLLGRNPWGVSAFVGIPQEGGNTPLYPHSPPANITGKPITGGLNDGPVYTSIFSQLQGLRLTREDKYAPFQSSLAVYHDDLGDYSTNEPTLDGTAEALVFMTFFANDEILIPEP
ncbi:MAG: glycoside hydrolase family 9 protein [Candidatus Neomarinimicrobiota bacterium]